MTFNKNDKEFAKATLKEYVKVFVTVFVAVKVVRWVGSKLIK